MTRESAIDVYVPELAGLLDRWRLPTIAFAAKGVPPHISLLYPWRPAPVGPSDITEAATVVAGISPFTITFRPLGRFPGVLLLRPEPDDSLRALMRKLRAAFPETPPYGGQFTDPTSHLTVAKATSEDELGRLEAEVATLLGPYLPLTLTIRDLAIEEEGSDGMWSVRTMIALSHRAQDPAH